MKRASAISGCRSISAISTSPPETIAELKKTREEMAVQKSMLEEKQSQQQTLVYEQKAQQAKLEQARNERKKTLSGLSLPFSRVSNN